MAYITKPNIHFSGDIKELHGTNESGVSNFNLRLTHAKDNLYNKLPQNTESTIGITITPFKETGEIITNYVLFDKDYSDKTIYFDVPEGCTVYYSEGFEAVVYKENTIITIQQISENEIVITADTEES